MTPEFERSALEQLRQIEQKLDKLLTFFERKEREREARLNQTWRLMMAALLGVASVLTVLVLAK